MDANMWQASLLPQSPPDLADRGIGFSGLPIDEQMLEVILSIKLFQDVEG